MKQPTAVAQFLTLLVWCAHQGLASAQPKGVEAARYINADGVEIIQNRTSTVLPVVAGPPASPAALAPRSSPPASRLQPPQRPLAIERTGLVANQLVQSQPRFGKVDDSDRIRILTAELVTEARELDTKRKLLKSPRGTNDLVDQLAQRLEREAMGHEENIQALNREIRRVASP